MEYAGRKLTLGDLSYEYLEFPSYNNLEVVLIKHAPQPSEGAFTLFGCIQQHGKCSDGVCGANMVHHSAQHALFRYTTHILNH